jgi:DNA-binding response OmpR family regulator
MTKVLVVEDEISLREPLVYLLQREGFEERI